MYHVYNNVLVWASFCFVALCLWFNFAKKIQTAKKYAWLIALCCHLCLFISYFLDTFVPLCVDPYYSGFDWLLIVQ